MLTVLFATHNGASTLPVVLEAYIGIQAPAGGWKLVIVDNGSSDRSKEIVSSYAGELPLTLLQENRRGKNSAINTGLQEIEGDLVVLTDDDAIPQPDWLAKFRETADAQPDFAVFGGSVVARWPADPPPWIFQWVPLGPVFALTNPAWPEGPVSPQHIFGPNMAVRAEVFRQGACFDSSIGPSSGSYTMGSETEFTLRLVEAGGKCWHCKQAVVAHIIRPQQMAKHWVLNRAVRYGRSRYRLEVSRSGLEPKRLFGYPRYLVREIATEWLRAQKFRVAGSEEALFKAQWRIKFLIGQAIEARASGADTSARV
jgi:glycosyltransferase involved in cell wall biosynthesis